MILTGGVSITDKEKEYVADAVSNGWDDKADNYIKQFEKAFANYVGAKYARSLSGGTQALTLALATLGIGEGDEVILPDLTYFACSDVVKLLGAEPVFVDVDYSLCIDPRELEKAITKKTKAIMPVWLYGNAPNMDAIMDIAHKHSLYVVEDACPAVGSFYNYKHAGTFGEFGCFSFHGAKIMTTGFGGMLVTDDDKLYEKMMWLSDHGEDKTLPYRFWQTGIGYSFDLANINCALGLAQLERIEELVDKKRQIFDWYKEVLPVVDAEKVYMRLNRWLPCVAVQDRGKTMKVLKEADIDTRPLFFPISMFPMYKDARTPCAHFYGVNGINLPAGVQRTKHDIEYICSFITDAITYES